MSYRSALLITTLALLACPAPAPKPTSVPPARAAAAPTSRAVAAPTKPRPAAPTSRGLSRAEITRVVRAHEHVLRACYQSVLAVRPRLWGVFARVTAQVQSDGSLRDVHIDDLRGVPINAEFATCAGPEIRSWRFPRPRGGGPVPFKHVFIYRTRPGGTW